MQTTTKTRNYYDLLGISQSATFAEIKKAYFTKIRVLSNETHPVEFQELTEAYKILSKSDSKVLYDRDLLNNGAYQKKITRAVERMNSDQHANALPLLKSMLKDYPLDSLILQNIVICYISLNNFEEAKDILIRLETKSPNDLITLELLGKTYFNLKRHELAKTYVQKLIVLKPRETNYHIFLSNIHLDLKEYNAAIKTLERKFETEEENLYDYPILEELFFISMVAKREKYHNEIKVRIKSLPKSVQEQEQLLKMLINTCSSMNYDHNLYKGLVYLIKEINNTESPEVNDWIRVAESNIRKDLYYFGEKIPNNMKKNNIGNESIDYDVVEDGTGSIMWSIIFGILTSFILTPIGGVIVGFVWYFNARAIKKIIAFSGVFIIAIIVILAILGAL